MNLISIQSANVEIEKLRKTTGIELQTIRAELKKAEIKINSLELSVQQRVDNLIINIVLLVN